ncbi:unnamed protein product [Effrenium voratum]|nr:unnamed protein product [Effrenium voratum]
MGEDKAELVTQFDSLAEQGELSAAPWKLLLQQLGPAADAAPPLPAAVRTSLDQWCHKLRQEDYVIFRESLHDIADDQKALQEWQQRCRNRSQGSCSPSPKLDEESAKAMEQVESLIPDRAELVFLAQSGSFMYDLQVETSDMDFTLVYQALPEALLSPSPPPEEFSRHVNQGFASDKRGVVEFAGRELGSFMALLAKGNPKNVELLFSGKAAHRSWAWEELLEARTCFLTLRCAKQYMGFISERLYRAQDLLKVEEGDGLNPQKASELSKLLYHANHKMLELDRILQGGSPAVALTGKERQAVLQLRLQRPSSLAEARKLVEQAELFRAQLATDLKAAESEQRLPAEVEAEPLLRWLRSVRVRMALGVGPGPSGGAKPLAPLARTRSSEEQEAIKDLIQEISLSEGIQVVVAGYGICSRTLGTSHSKSDHDIKCIFVHPRDAYFGLKSMATTFKRQFAGAAAGDDVEISGWEARHAMQLLAEDNPAVLGLLLSPIIFLGEEWRARLEDMASKLFSRQRLMYHWYNHGRKNFQSYIKSSEEPLRKRYVHVLRPLLTLAWQQRQGSDCFRWPPARLDQLLASVAELGALSQEEAASVVSLIEHVEELPQALPRVGALDALILRLLDRELSFAKPAAAESDAWHKLCVELISTITEARLPGQRSQARAAPECTNEADTTLLCSIVIILAGKASGSGPDEGWISAKLKDKALAVRIEDLAPVLVCFYSGGMTSAQGRAHLRVFLEAARAAGLSTQLVLDHATEEPFRHCENWPRYLDALQREVEKPELRPRRVILFAHSHGCLQAYGLAQRLGSRVLKLYVAARRPPSLPLLDEVWGVPSGKDIQALDDTTLLEGMLGAWRNQLLEASRGPPLPPIATKILATVREQYASPCAPGGSCELEVLHLQAKVAAPILALACSQELNEL